MFCSVWLWHENVFLKMFSIVISSKKSKPSSVQKKGMRNEIWNWVLREMTGLGPTRVSWRSSRVQWCLLSLLRPAACLCPLSLRQPKLISCNAEVAVVDAGVTDNLRRLLWLRWKIIIVLSFPSVENLGICVNKIKIEACLEMAV